MQICRKYMKVNAMSTLNLMYICPLEIGLKPNYCEKCTQIHHKFHPPKVNVITEYGQSFLT